MAWYTDRAKRSGCPFCTPLVFHFWRISSETSTPKRLVFNRAQS
nr:MAG TPA: hypothetical protein [Caudoviricetes sp.]